MVLLNAFINACLNGCLYRCLPLLVGVLSLSTSLCLASVAPHTTRQEGLVSNNTLARVFKQTHNSKGLNPSLALPLMTTQNLLEAPPAPPTLSPKLGLLPTNTPSKTEVIPSQHASQPPAKQREKNRGKTTDKPEKTPRFKQKSYYALSPVTQVVHPALTSKVQLPAVEQTKTPLEVMAAVALPLEPVSPKANTPPLLAPAEPVVNPVTGLEKEKRKEQKRRKGEPLEKLLDKNWNAPAAPKETSTIPVQPSGFYLKQAAPFAVAEEKQAVPSPLELRASLSQQSGYPASKATVELTQGKGHVMSWPSGLKRVAISNPAVASAMVVSSTQIQLIGQSPGVATLTIWPQGSGNRYVEYDVNVRRDVSLLERQIQQIAPRVSVTPLVAKDTVILRGEVETLEESQLVLQLAKAFFGGGNSSTANPSAGGASSSAAAGGNSTSASTGASSSSGSSSGASAGSVGASNMPGSAILGNDSSVINLMHVKGMPSTRLELVRMKLQALHPSIVLDVVQGSGGLEKAILTGKVPSTGYIAKAINISSLFYGQPGLKVVSGPAGNTVRDAGSEDFHTAEAFSDNMDVNLLQGLVVTDTSGNVVSLMEVSKRPQVRCRVRILDVSRRANDVLGVPFVQYLGGTLQLGADLTAPGSPAANGSGLRNLKGITGAIVGNNSLNVTLQALQDKQLIHSLAEPTLMMLSGEKASFLAGGEVPVPISDANGRITLEYKEFGIRLNLIATVTDEDKIHLQVAPEVSTIDPSLAFNSSVISIPGIRSRRMQTTVEMLPNQNFVLGGLFSSDDTRSLSQFPGLGNIPIIGSFFRTHYNNKTNSEMVVLIQPEIITAEDVAAIK